MTETAIRLYTPADAAAFRALNEAWITAYFQLEPKDRQTLTDPQGTILTPGGQIFVAETDSEVVGVVALVKKVDGGFEVAKMAVAPSAQGQGIGRRLLTAAQEWATAHGASRLYLESNSTLTAAIRLYESFGFRHLPSECVPPTPYTRCDVFMEKAL